MKLRRSISRRSYIISVTLFLLATLFGYYFLVFLPNQESKLIAQRVRALDRIGQNFQEKFKVYHKNVIQNIQDSDFVTLDKAMAQADMLLLQRKKIQSSEDSLKSIDSLLLTVNESIRAKKDSIENKYSSSVTNQNISLIEESDNLNDLIRFENVFATPFLSFFEPLKLRSSFEGYIVYQDSFLVYQSLPGEVLRVPAQLYTELNKDQSDERYVRHNLESRAPERHENPRVFEAGTKVKLASIDYRLFCADFTTADKHQKNQWTIYGLVTKDHFDAEKKQIPFLSLIFISLGLLLLLFSMPLMKLFFMSSIERLHRQDALFTPPTFIVCSAIATLMVLMISKYYLSDIRRVDVRLEKLAKKVATNFQDEMQDIYRLAQFSPDRSQISSDSSISIVKGGKLTNSSTPNFNLYPHLRSMYWLNSKGEQTFEYTMLDSIHHKYSDKKRPTYANRPYFRAIEQGKGYELISKDTLSYLQSIVSWTTGESASVFSLALSPDKNITSRGNTQSSVLAISTVLHSVTDPVLPPGYSFHIMDDTGLILYHTDRQKNLQENFLQEVNNQPSLVAAMASRSKTATDVSYYNKNYRTYLQPLSNTPWYLVTTYDTEYLESPYQHILAFCTLGIILISAVSAIQFLVISLVYRRPSKLKRKLLTFRWLWPYQTSILPLSSPTNKIISYPRTVRYLIIFFLNVAYGILLFVYNQIDEVSLPQTMGNFLTVVILSYSATFALLQENQDRRYWTILIGSVISSLLIMYASTWVISDKEQRFYLLIWVGLLGAALSYVTWAAYPVLAHKQKNTVYQESDKWIIGLLLVIIVGLSLLLLRNDISLDYNAKILQQLFVWASLYLLALLACIIGNWAVANISSRQGAPKTPATSARVSGINLSLDQIGNKGFKRFYNQLLTRHSFCLMIFSYLVLSSFLSVWFLFSKTYDYEKYIWSKYSLYQISQRLEDRDQQLRSRYKLNDLAYKEVNGLYQRYDKVKEKSLYYRALDISESRLAETTTPKKNTTFDKFLLKLRPMVTDLAIQTNGFIQQSGEGWFRVPETTDVLLALPDNHYFEDSSTNSDLLALGITPTKFLNFSLNNFSVRHLFPILFVLLLLGATYRLLKFSIYRLFGVQVFHFQRVIQVDDELMKGEQNNLQLRQPNYSPHKFIVSMPFAGAEELYGPENNDYIKFDFSRALEDNIYPEVREKVLKKKEENVILEHFSYGIEDQKTNERRLVLLENLLANNNRVTIVSKLTPMQVTAKYEEIIERATDSNGVDELETRVSRWKDILSSFIKLYYSKLVCERDRKRLAERATVEELIYHEMSVNKAYFKRMNGTLVDLWHEDLESPTNDEKANVRKIELTNSVKPYADSVDEDIKEEILLKIQSMAQPFYFSLWNTCSTEERYILYDLADDGFVNIANKPVLMALMEKGLIYYDESFHIMNESFQNFILSNIKPSEALKMEKEARNHGRWSVYSTVILLLIVSLIFFVVFAHESIVNQAIALLAGVTAAIPYLLRLVGLVGLSTGSKSSGE